MYLRDHSNDPLVDVRGLQVGSELVGGKNRGTLTVWFLLLSFFVRTRVGLQERNESVPESIETVVENVHSLAIISAKSLNIARSSCENSDSSVIDLVGSIKHIAPEVSVFGTPLLLAPIPTGRLMFAAA